MKEKIELKYGRTYLDGFGQKIKIYNSIVGKGYIFYIGKYIDQDTNEILDDMDKNAECKFFKNGQHYLYYQKEWSLISEVE